MALSWVKKLTRKRKAEVKCCKPIMEDPELHDTHNGKRRKQYVVDKQKKKGKKPSKKVIYKSRDSNGELRSRIGRPKNSYSWQKI